MGILKKIFKYFLVHKIKAVILIAIIFVASYFIYDWRAGNQIKMSYVTAAAEKGTLIVSVSGTGQISATSQVDIKPKVSGDVVYVAVKAGDEVKSGDLLFRLDSVDAQKDVRDAETALDTSRLELEDLQSPPDELDLLKAENNFLNAQESKNKAEDNIEQGYEDAFNAVSDVFLDLPELVTGARDILYSETIATAEKISPKTSNDSTLLNSILSTDYDKREELETFISMAEKNYETGRTKYDINLNNYKNTARTSSSDKIESLLDETLDTLRLFSDAVKSETNMLDFWTDYRTDKNLPVFSSVSLCQTNLNSYTSQVNSSISSLLSVQRSLDTNRESLADAERSIKELGISLNKLKAGADELSLRAKKIAVSQKEDALADAKQNLYDHFVRAPFDGIIASINVQKGDTAGSSAAATIITKQQMAEISLNEVDVAKVKVGQKANIVLDAIENLNITGVVSEVDAVGTVSQGVVNYGVKITLDTQDAGVKPGMSLSVSIITEMKQDVIIAPSSAVKTQGGSSYVEVMSRDGTVEKRTVVEGLSGDTNIEIISGINEGDMVVTQTITAGATTQATQSTGFRVPGIGGMSR